MHCYPSELKEGGERLTALLHRFNVRLNDMGHTHYNEVSNDGVNLYAATRSIGQIEEGKAGYSLITFHQGVVSWHFLEPSDAPVVVITSPADERLLSERSLIEIVEGSLVVSALVWSASGILSVVAKIDGKSFDLQQQDKSCVWKSVNAGLALSDGIYDLKVTAEDISYRKTTDTVRVLAGRQSFKQHERRSTNNENALEAWEERGLLGTQFGPNKNGRKW